MKAVNKVLIIITVIVMVAVSGASPRKAAAGLNKWTYMNGPYGGNVDDLAISPNYASDQIMFAASDISI